MLSKWQNKTCLLIGKVVERESKSIRILKLTDPIKTHYNTINIDENGNFEYVLSAPFLERYELVFEDEFQSGSWREIQFFPDSDTIEFILFPMEKFASNSISGSALSLQEKIMIAQLENELKPRYDSLNQELNSLKNRSDTALISQVTAELERFSTMVDYWILDYARKDRSIFGYAKFLDLVKAHNSSGSNGTIPIDTFQTYSDVFQRAFPGHPYGAYALQLMNNFQDRLLGRQYIDFTGKSSAGTPIRLSDIVSDNRFTLLDIWAPWCAPCIKKSRALLPFFKQYRKSGFSVISIVGGIKNEVQFTNAVRKHNYPWPQIPEVNDEKGIWKKYGIVGGGSQFLIDSKGNIVSINPDADQLEAFLSAQ